MRRLTWLVATLALCLWPSVAQAQITVVQSACNTGNSVSSIVVTLGATTTAGNGLTAVSQTYSTNRSQTFADGNAGETWTTPTNGDVTFGTPIFGRVQTSATTVSTGSTTVTATYSGGLSGDGYVCVIEWTNPNATINSVAARDGINTSSTTFTTAAGGTSSGSVTTTAANAILIGHSLGGGGQTMVCDATYTSVRSAADSTVCYKIVASTGTYTVTNTTAGSENGGTQLTAFDGSGGGGGAVATPRLTLVGVGNN